jgi:hypothetical protein
MATKNRHSSGGLRYSEEDLLAMTAKVRGATVTAAGRDFTLRNAATTQPNTSSVKTVSVQMTELSESPLTIAKSPAKKRKPKNNITPDSSPRSIEDPDWTAPRTVKITRRKGGTSINQHVADVVHSIKTSVITTSVSENHLGLVFDGARMLTLNEIFSLLPYQPYLVFGYKKAWAAKVDEALALAKAVYGKRMPEFSDSCLFIGYRRSSRLVDRDGLASCFKYILDDIRHQMAVNEKILKDDNPNLIFDTPCFQSTGPALIGVRLERVNGWSEADMNEKILLSQDSVSQKLGF